MIKEKRNAFEQPSTELEDNEEWQVTIYADLERMMDTMANTSPGGGGEELLKREVYRMLDEYREKSFGWMLKQAKKAELNEILSGELDQNKKDMILNSTYLVSKRRREDFTTVVKSLQKEYEGRGLILECTGPRVPNDSLW